MGIKSTHRLTRGQAELRYIKLYNDRQLKKAKAKLAKLSDTELEDVLEKWNDEAFDGEGFLNFLIVPNGFTER